MAIESQGVQIRRQSTAAGSTAQTIAATIAISSAGGTITRSDAGSFIVDGFSSGMRVETDSTSNSTRVFTLSAVAATSMAINEPCITQSTGVTITITGHALVAIGTVTGFNGPNGSAAVIDITHLGSTAKEKQIGLRDEGQVSLDIIFDRNATALHSAMQADRAARTRRIYDIKLTDNGAGLNQPSAFYFDGYISGFSLTGAIDDVVKGNVTIEISSAVRSINPV